MFLSWSLKSKKATNEFGENVSKTALIFSDELGVKNIQK